MSDDLISRKALIAELEKWCGKQRYLIPENVWELIKTAPTAFDKEKMIGELKEAEQSCREANDTCGVEAIEYAIDIVDKGGIE